MASVPGNDQSHIGGSLPADVGHELPAEIYIPLVDSLFKERRALLIGALINTGAIFATYIKSGAIELLLCGVVFAAIACGRFLFMQRYQYARDNIVLSEQAQKWECGYVVGAASSVGVLGLWSYLSFAITSDPYIQLISFSMTIGYVIGIFGRNFGSPRFVLVQILCAWVPMTLTLLLHGGVYHWFFALLLVPFFQAVKLIGERLRRTLLDAIIATRNVTKLADRFDTALENSPHGILMIDRDGRIQVANNRLSKLLRLPDKEDLQGWSVKRLLHVCVKLGRLNLPDLKNIWQSLEGDHRKLSSGLVIELNDERTLEFAFQGMADGGMVIVVQDITKRRQAEQMIHRMAKYDSLTGLLNRNSFRQSLDQAFSHERFSHSSALHFLDLDNFKQVNDALGHVRGDMLLQLVAERLSAQLRGNDVAGRIGGDEFVILQGAVDHDDQAASFAKRVIDEISKPYVIDGNEVVIGVSIGIARLPRDGVNPDQILKHADMAMYSAKSQGRGAHCFFDQQMELQILKRMRLEGDLKAALSDDQFELHYQPIVDLSTGRIKTCEALLRWRHPERGMVSPAEFIPLAEDMGAIAEIGKLVIEKACRDCATWPNDVAVAVNFSPLQFERSDVASIVENALSISKLPPNRLEVEITEGVLLQNTAEITETLEFLRKLGAKISLDDFGTGYSSLSYLHSFPLDKVKIDRSFLHGLTHDRRSRVLLCGITRLSSELGLRVTIEGIETDEQLFLVKKEGFAHEGQGFLFSRPVPMDQLDLSIAQPYGELCTSWDGQAGNVTQLPLQTNIA